MRKANTISLKKYKECSGKNCNNKGHKFLKIQYIHKKGWFCKVCVRKLLDDGLVEEVFN